MVGVRRPYERPTSAFVLSVIKERGPVYKRLRKVQGDGKGHLERDALGANDDGVRRLPNDMLGM